MCLDLSFLVPEKRSVSGLLRPNSGPRSVERVEGSHHEEDYMDSFLELNDELMMEMLFHPGPHLAAFPAVFARRLNKVEHLEISSVYWRDCAIHGSFFFALSEFTSITRVELNSIYFTTLQEFGRLLCALPNVSDLVCSMLTWSSTQFNPLIFQRKGPKMRVAFLAIYVGLEDYLSSTADILNWFVATKSYTCLAEVQLSVVQKIGASIGSLLEAAGASIERVSLQLYAGSAWDESRGTVDQYLNLSKNIHLKSLCLSISEFDDGDSGWLSTLLSQITSFEVEDILLDLQASVPSTYDMHSALDRLHCDLLDDILARPQFENLRNITFKSVVSGVAVWESALRSRLPKLDARGIVKTNLSEVCDRRPFHSSSHDILITGLEGTTAGSWDLISIANKQNRKRVFCLMRILSSSPSRLDRNVFGVS
ncbi:hypothetical protein AcW1_010105 [Taiwanofungus camphoratus]|nr:hypothetical protein AcV5_002999 [Antrodia cinnamomea]KAI0946717.1 hypothetical protein AcW1_010105 [Antrodia cinnamomea]